jgi:hypothetical protein
MAGGIIVRDKIIDDFRQLVKDNICTSNANQKFPEVIVFDAKVNLNSQSLKHFLVDVSSSESVRAYTCSHHIINSIFSINNSNTNTTNSKTNNNNSNYDNDYILDSSLFEKDDGDILNQIITTVQQSNTTATTAATTASTSSSIPKDIKQHSDYIKYDNKIHKMKLNIHNISFDNHSPNAHNKILNNINNLKILFNVLNNKKHTSIEVFRNNTNDTVYYSKTDTISITIPDITSETIIVECTIKYRSNNSIFSNDIQYGKCIINVNKLLTIQNDGSELYVKLNTPLNDNELTQLVLDVTPENGINDEKHDILKLKMGISAVVK